MTPRPARIPDSVLPGLTDTHCHLQDSAFDADRADVLDRARRCGMVRILLAGTDAEDSDAAAQLAKKSPDLLRFAAGVHPHAAATLDASALQAIRMLLGDPQAVAAGEIGLDYYRDLAPRAEQRRAFQSQLELAAEADLPIVLHVREAADDALGMLADAPLPRGGVWHAFAGDPATAESALRLGLYLGAGGPLTYPKAAGLRDTFRAAPLERLLLETDAPYLPPDGNRGARNEPALVGEIVRRLALDRHQTPESMTAILRENANRLFRWE
jgi:TatD DNase family protein